MPTSDPEKQRQYARDHYWRHREALLVKATEYRETHRELLARKQWAYYQIHKDAILARRRARKATKTTEETP